jgi:hypothetical protein
MIEGITISLGGKDYIVPPLNLHGVKARETDIELISNTGDAAASPFGIERLSAICRIAHSALARNYPDMRQEQLEDMIDLGNAGDLIEAVLGVSGLTKHSGGEADGSPGEAQAAPATGTPPTAQ